MFQSSLTAGCTASFMTAARLLSASPPLGEGTQELHELQRPTAAIAACLFAGIGLRSKPTQRYGRNEPKGTPKTAVHLACILLILSCCGGKICMCLGILNPIAGNSLSASQVLRKEPGDEHVGEQPVGPMPVANTRTCIPTSPSRFGWQEKGGLWCGSLHVRVELDEDSDSEKKGNVQHCTLIEHLGRQSRKGRPPSNE